MMRLPSGATVVNPGSVGYPAYDDDQPYPHVMEAGTPHARYAVVDDATGRWEVHFRTVIYDWEHAAEVAEGNRRPKVARGPALLRWLLRPEEAEADSAVGQGGSLGAPAVLGS